jgi:outer membrane protein insertion porin family
VEIRRRWGLKPGAPFDVEYPDYFLNRVREDGLFDNLGQTKPSVKVDDKTQTVDVTLAFHGEPKPGRRAAP